MTLKHILSLFKHRFNGYGAYLLNASYADIEHATGQQFKRCEMFHDDLTFRVSDYGVIVYENKNDISDIQAESDTRGCYLHGQWEG